MDGSLQTKIFQLQAFILAGGESRRMGRDKSQLLLENRTFTDRIAETLFQITDSVTLVGSRQANSSYASVPDVYPAWGALGGLHAALAASVPNGPSSSPVTCRLSPPNSSTTSILCARATMPWYLCNQTVDRNRCPPFIELKLASHGPPN